MRRGDTSCSCGINLAIICVIFLSLTSNAQDVGDDFFSSLQGSWPSPTPYQGQTRSEAFPFSPWTYGSTSLLANDFSEVVYRVSCGGRYAPEASTECREMSIWNENNIIRNTPGTLDAAFQFTAPVALMNVSIQLEYIVNSSDCPPQSDGQTYKLWLPDRILQRDFICSRPPYAFSTTTSAIAQGARILLAISRKTHSDFDTNAAQVIIRGIVAPSTGTATPPTMTPRTARPGYFRSSLMDSWPTALRPSATRSESEPRSDWSYGSTISDQNDFIELVYQTSGCQRLAGRPASLFAYDSSCDLPAVWKEGGDFYAQSSSSRDASFRFEAPENLLGVEINVTNRIRDPTLCSSQIPVGRTFFGNVNIWVSGVKMWSSRLECTATIAVLSGRLSSLSRRGAVIVSFDYSDTYPQLANFVEIEVNAQRESTDGTAGAPPASAESFTQSTAFYIIVAVGVVVVVGGIVLTVVFALYRRNKRKEKRRRLAALHFEDSVTPSPMRGRPDADEAVDANLEFSTMPTQGPTGTDAQSPQRGPWVPTNVTPQRPIPVANGDPERVVRLAAGQPQPYPAPRQHVHINEVGSPSPPAAPRDFALSEERDEDVARAMQMADEEEMVAKEVEEVEDYRPTEERRTSSVSSSSASGGEGNPQRRSHDGTTPVGREIEVVEVSVHHDDEPSHQEGVSPVDPHIAQGQQPASETAEAPAEDGRVEVVFSDSDED